RLNLLRLWLCAEARVLRFDLLHLLRIGLLPLGPRFSLRVLLADCRSCAGFSRGLLHTLSLLPLLNLLLLPLLCRHSRRGRISRFLVCAILPGGACPLIVTAVPLAVVPTRLQPMPVNSLSVN